ncbi:MAG TPA: hypothetical protein VE505_13290, partial [Vicinamibacterales bacterium]|nr:hypothetical protein [Vicinamibacterales bacterium]
MIVFGTTAQPHLKRQIGQNWQVAGMAVQPRISTRQMCSTGRFAMTVTASTLLGRPMWYELMTTDMKAAEAFYTTVVGWTLTPFDGSPQPYTM